MITIRQGDLLSAGVDIIAHQVNCQGVMGSGVAKQIKNQFPLAYEWYHRLILRDFQNRKDLLGTCQTIIVRRSPLLYVANLYTQYEYGSMFGRKEPYTDYQAFRKALRELNRLANELSPMPGRKLSIGMPYLIGCGRGGGDWAIISGIIQSELSEQNVYLYRLP